MELSQTRVWDGATRTWESPNPDQGDLPVQGFNNCPFCMRTDELSVTFERSMTKQQPYEYVFDLTLLCRGCGVIMDEMGLHMGDAIASLQDRWNRRPTRDDFSAELFKAYMADKQERWLAEELKKWGPFTPDQMATYFDKSPFELIRMLVTALDAATQLQQNVEQLERTISEMRTSVKEMRAGHADRTLLINNAAFTGEIVSPETMDSFRAAGATIGAQISQLANSLNDGLENGKLSDFVENIRKAREEEERLIQEDMQRRNNKLRTQGRGKKRVNGK